MFRRSDREMLFTASRPESAAASIPTPLTGSTSPAASPTIRIRSLPNQTFPADKAGEKNNPYREWIGADIRSDPWGYMAPADPEYAADMAYRDAFLSHRRQGIYGELFFSAAIAAAFALDDPVTYRKTVL